MTSARILVLLCTYNERQNVPEVVRQLHETLPRADVLVVDDASPDGTGDWVREEQARDDKLFLLSRSGKLGLGSALRDGIAWCLDRNYDGLINLDADQSHDPQATARLLSAVVDETSVVIGSRYVTGGETSGLSVLRRVLSRSLNAYAGALLRLPIRDCSGSFRFYPVRLLRKLDLKGLKCNGYGFLEEILVHLRRVGAEFIEIPITYHARGAGSSKLSAADALGAVSVIHRLAVTRK